MQQQHIRSNFWYLILNWCYSCLVTDAAFHSCWAVILILESFSISMWPEGWDVCRTVGCHALPRWRRQSVWLERGKTPRQILSLESCQWMTHLSWDPGATFPEHFRRTPLVCKLLSAAFYYFVCIVCGVCKCSYVATCMGTDMKARDQH